VKAAEAPASPQDRQAGMTIIGTLVLLSALTMLGSGVYLTTHRDIVHTARDTDRIRAEFAAESAVQWALLELIRYDGGRRQFTRATHDRNGITPLSPDPRPDPVMDGEFRGLDPRRLSAYSGSRIRRESDGWIALTATSKAGTYSRGPSENIAFKIWYPDRSTIRVSGRGTVDGTTAILEVKGRLDSAWVPF
jgi:hypothetical protein